MGHPTVFLIYDNHYVIMINCNNHFEIKSIKTVSG